MKNRPTVECVLDCQAKLGEGAIWSTAEQVLYWVSIPDGRLCRFDPASGTNQEWRMGRPIGCFALKRGSGFEHSRIPASEAE